MTRSSRFSLTLAAALAFTTGLVARVWVFPQLGTAGSADALPAADFGKMGNSGRAEASAANASNKPPGRNEPGGVMRDTLVRKAVESADLATGVREIMAREQEDHCADTRLVCLVENLPSERLGELPGLLNQFQGNEFVVKFLIGPWAKRDPAAALAWVEAHPSLKASGTNAFLTGWTRNDPAAALAWVESQSASSRGAQLRSALVEGMSETDPAGAFALMQSKGWISKSPDALLRLLQNWGGRDPAGALAGLRSVSGGLGLSLGDAKEDPDHQDGSRDTFDALLKAMLYGAFQRSPQEAMALVDQLSPGELSAGAPAVAREILTRDPGLAESLFAGSPDDRARPLLLGLAQTESNAVFSNLGRITDPAFRQELLVQAARGGSSEEPVPASALPGLRSAIAEIADPEDKQKVAGALCPLVAKEDPRFAADLWSGLPEPQQLKGPVLPFFAELGKSDARAAIALCDASSAEVRPIAQKVLSRVLAQSDPQLGLDMVLREPDPAQRASSGATLLAFWAERDPAGAAAALEAHAGDFDLRKLQFSMALAGQFQTPNRFENHQIPTQRAMSNKLGEMLAAGDAQP